MRVASSWITDPQVAEEQLTLVKRELQGVWPDTYHVFVRALQALSPAVDSTLLDVGCGVGHYGVIVDRAFPGVHYTGTDASPSMIRVARGFTPDTCQFEVADWYSNRFGAFDYVLSSAAVEYAYDPPAAMAFLLRQARGPVILHRLHLAERPRSIMETTYAGHSEAKRLWSVAELRRIFKDAGRRISHEEFWHGGTIWTVALTKEEDGR